MRIFSTELKKDRDFFSSSEYSCNLTLANTADVLLMHKRDLDFPKLDQLKRNPDQIWLLWHDESNENTPAINKYRFNWTITYRTSAEASLAAYGITIVKSKPWSQRRFNAWIEKEFNQRTNQAVWYDDCSFVDFDLFFFLHRSGSSRIVCRNNV